MPTGLQTGFMPALPVGFADDDPLAGVQIVDDPQGGALEPPPVFQPKSRPLEIPDIDEIFRLMDEKVAFGRQQQFSYVPPEELSTLDDAAAGIRDVQIQQEQSLPFISQPLPFTSSDPEAKELEALRNEVATRAKNKGTLLDPKYVGKFARIEQLKGRMKQKYPQVASLPVFQGFDSETTKWYDRTQGRQQKVAASNVRRLQQENPTVLAGNELAGAAQGVLSGGVQLASPLMRAMGQGEEADRVLAESKALQSAQQQSVRDQKMGWLRGTVNEAIPGAASSITEAAALGPIGRIAKTAKGAYLLGTAAMATGFGVTTANDAYSEAKRAGLPSKEAAKYAAIHGALEAGIMLIFQGLGSKIAGLAGMEQYFIPGGKRLADETARQWLWRLTKGLLGEGIEENTTAVLQQINSATSLPGAEDQANWIDPTKQGFEAFWDSPMMQAVRQATAQTILMMGLAETTSQAGRLLQRRLDRFTENPSQTNYQKAVDAGLPPTENPNRANRAEIAESLSEIRESINQRKGVIRDEEAEEGGSVGLREVAAPSSEAHAAGAEIGSAPAFDESAADADVRAALAELDAEQGVPVEEPSGEVPSSEFPVPSATQEVSDQPQTVIPTIEQPGEVSLPPPGPSLESPQADDTTPPLAEAGPSAAAAPVSSETSLRRKKPAYGVRNRLTEPEQRGAVSEPDSTGLNRTQPDLTAPSPPPSTSAVSSPVEAPVVEVKTSQVETFAGGVATTPEGNIEQTRQQIVDGFNKTNENGKGYGATVSYFVTPAQKKAALQAGQTAEEFANQVIGDGAAIRHSWADSVQHLPQRGIEVPPEVMKRANAIIPPVATPPKPKKSRKKSAEPRSTAKEPSNAVPAQSVEDEPNATRPTETQEVPDAGRRPASASDRTDRPADKASQGATQRRDGESDADYAERNAEVERLNEVIRMADELLLTQTRNGQPLSKSELRELKTAKTRATKERDALASAEPPAPPKEKAQRVRPSVAKPKKATEPAKATPEQLRKLIEDEANYNEIRRTVGDDAANDLFVKLTDPTAIAARQSLLQYDPAEPFVPWAVSVAKNLQADSKKKARNALGRQVSPEAIEQVAKGDKVHDLSERASAAEKDASEKADKLRAAIKKSAKKNLGSLAPIDAEVFDALVQFTVAAIKAKTLKFRAYVARLRAELGGDIPANIRERLVPMWNKLRDKYGLDTADAQAMNDVLAEKPTDADDEGFGDTPTPIDEPEAGEGGKTYGLKNRKVEEFREDNQLDDVKKPLDPTMWDAQEASVSVAKERMKLEPGWAPAIVTSLLDSPRSVTPLEMAGLQILNTQAEKEYEQSYRDLRNAATLGGEPAKVAMAQQRLDTAKLSLDRIQQAGAIAKRNWSNVGWVLRAEFDENYSLAAIEKRWVAANEGRPLSDAEREKADKLASEYAKLKQQLDELEKKYAAQEQELALEREHRKRLEESTRPHPVGERKAPTPRATKAREKAKAAVADFLSFMKGKAYSIETAGGEALLKAANVVKAYVELGIAKFSDFMEQLAKDAGDAVKQYQSDFRQAWDSVHINDITSRIPEEFDASEASTLVPIVRDIHKFVIERDGLGPTPVDREKAVDGVFEIIKDALPDMTREQTARAMSGIGEFKELSKDRVDQIRREQKAQLLLLEQLQDFQAGKVPPATGVERTPSSDYQRELRQKVNEAKKLLGVTPEQEAGKLKTALAAAKTAVRNRIADLKKEIANKERIVKTRNELKPDEELTRLRAERDELQTVHEQLFGKRGHTEEQQRAITEKALDRAIAGLEADLKEGKLFPDAKRPPLSTPAIEVKRSRLAELRATRKEMQLGTAEYQERSDAAYERALNQRLAYWAARLASGDFAPQPKRPERTLTTEQTDLQLAINKVKAAVAANEEEYRKQHRSITERAIEGTAEALNTSRAIMTSFDLSAVARQGGWLSFAHPLIALRAIGPMLKSFASESAFANITENIANRKNAPLYKKAKLSLTGVHGKLSDMEEAYMSRLAEKIPGVAGSERAYVAFLNLLRANTFDSMVAALARNGTVTDAEAEIIANYINVATGRGDLGKFQAAAVPMATVFFSPRFVASRFQLLLGQPLLRQLGKGSLRVRAKIAGEYAKTLLALGLFYTLAKLFMAGGDDDDIEFDPRSSDFGKLKFGATRIDPLSGLSQTIVPLWKIIKGETQKPSGVIVPLRGDKVPYGGDTTLSVLGRWLRGKLSPAAGTVVDILAGEDMSREQVTPQTVALRNLWPMSFRDISEAVAAQGATKGAAMGLLALLGVGVQTYQKYDPEVLKRGLAMDAARALSTEDKTKATSGAHKGLKKSEYETGQRDDAVIQSSREVLRSTIPNVKDALDLYEKAYEAENETIYNKHKGKTVVIDGSRVKEAYRRGRERIKSAYVDK